MARQEEPRPQPRLYLVTPVLAEPGDVAASLTAALGAADVAAVLLRLSDDAESTLIKRAKALAPVIQNAGAALILDNRPELVARAGADGAHLTGADAFRGAAGALKPDRIAGAGGLSSKHDAMNVAEGGADYVMFGEPDEHGHRAPFEQILDRVQWWQEVFQTPCVGFAASLDEVAPLARSGADFVALADFIFGGTRPIQDVVAEAATRLKITDAVS